LKTIAELSPVLRAIKVVYKVSGDSDQQEYFMKLKALKEKEKVVGTSLLGPHRDDFTAKIEEEEVSGFLSRGQLRSVTLGLKILERDFLEQSLDNAPVILLDDIFSEFDRDHQHRLVKFLESFEQVFFSTTHVEEVEDFLPRNTWQFFVNNGIISTDVQKDL
jgi:DNA replication and repair protein RecF